MKLAGQVAVVTGAGRGIGRAVAVRLAREGAAVALAARSAPELEGVAREIAQAGGRAAVIPVDVRQEALVEALTRRALAEWGRVDVLVNAAGLATFAPVTDAKLDDWDQMLAVNLRGAVLCCRAVLPAMIAQRRGTIINVGSVVTSRALTGSAAYTASKYGLLGFSRVLAEEMRGARGPRRGAHGGGHRHPALGRHAGGAGPGAHAAAGPGGGGRPAHGLPGPQRDPGRAHPAARGRHPVRRSGAPRQAPGPSAILRPQFDPPRERGNQGGTNAYVD